MPKNLVVCCDGTGNQIEENLSNVLKLFRIVEKNAQQRVYYEPGIGTLGLNSAWAKFRANLSGVFGLLTGSGLDGNILSCYRFLCEHYESGDQIYLFGFSRGAYAMRALAGFINMAGLLWPDQLNLAGAALQAYKDAGNGADMMQVWRFQRITSSRSATIHFLGAWDTVASVLVPWRGWLGLPGLQTLPYTRTNPSVRTFRHAIALDERRRMFRLNRWTAQQLFKAGRDAAPVPQDCLEVLFAGVHADVGGGYPEAESAISKFPLRWMIAQAEAHGLLISEQRRQHMVEGIQPAVSKTVYVPPNAAASIHDSMNPGWACLEIIPKRVKYKEWPVRRSLLGFYLPLSEPRQFSEISNAHESVRDRIEKHGIARPPNLPEPVNWVS